MNKGVVQEKIREIEAEIQLLKITVASEPDLAVDEVSWANVKPIVKKARAKLYKARYA